LINEKGESFPVDDYNLETSYMAESQAKGYLYQLIQLIKMMRNLNSSFGEKVYQRSKWSWIYQKLYKDVINYARIQTSV
jgi:hypothetical protein